MQNDMHFFGEIIDLFINADGSTCAEDEDGQELC